VGEKHALYFVQNLLIPKSVARHLDTSAQPGGGAFGAFPPPEIFKTLHSNFDICRSFQRIKMKFYILMILRNLIGISVSCSLTFLLTRFILKQVIWLKI